MATRKELKLAKARNEVLKALKWIVRSGLATMILTGLLDIVKSLQEGEITIEYAKYGLMIIAINTVINVADFYRHESTK